MKRFICVQTGARRNYAVPKILSQNSLLEAFYNDLNASSGLGEAIKTICPSSLRKGAISRLLSREVPPDVVKKTCTFDLPSIKYLFRQKLAGGNVTKAHYWLQRFDEDFSQAMIRKGLGQATHVFSMFGEGSQFIEYAKNKGLTTVVEEYLSPLTHKIIQEEREKYPEIEPPLPQEIIDSDYAWFKKLCKSVDVFLAPSSFVVQGLEAFGVSSSQCRIVPYAASDKWFKVENRPVKGRVLFVGTAELRKGIHTLGMAAQKLAPYSYEFRVAGNASITVRDHPLLKHFMFLGRVPRTEIHKEFEKADVFVLPSLAEGSAEVTYEALATGLPVITTKASGSVVRHGIDGFIVPESDANALADAIKEILENRPLRDQMAAVAKHHAQDYTWDKYAERLLTVFQSI